MEDDEAQNAEARKKASTKDLVIGFLLLIVGVAITLGTWAAAKAGGSYWAMWGAMVVGMFYILRGLYRKVTSTTDSGTRLRWVLGSIILIGGFVGGGVAITNMMNPPELSAPSESFIVWDDNSDWEDETQGKFMLSGTITNTHSDWSIKSVVLEVQERNEADLVIKTYEVSVIPGTVPPGGKEVYSKRVQASDSCVSVNYRPVWEWVPP